VHGGLSEVRAGTSIGTAIAYPTGRQNEEVPGCGRDRSTTEVAAQVSVGPEAKIRAVAEQFGIDIRPYRLVDAPHGHAAAKAVEIVRAGEAESLMKGSLHTDELMGEVVRKDTGLRTERRISDVFIMDVPTYPKPLAVTDAAINIFPDLETKVDIVQNAIDMAHALGRERPKAKGRVVVAHLGSGASMCAMTAGRSIDSTMGFTALDGLPMGTRCGALDPGVVLHLIRGYGMDADAIERMLYHECGLKGVSGVSNDMRTLLASDDPRARRAIDLSVWRIRRELGALAAVQGGLDGLVFTAGIGERSAEIRKRVCEKASWLGIELDHAANARGGPRISADGSRVAVYAIPTDEEQMIARHTLAVLRRPTPGAA
jgi:hypothetical protein